MGTFLRLLSLILCFELIVGPMQPSLSLMGQVAFAQETTTSSCPTGFTYDSTLNRCLTKDETTKVMNLTAACNGDKQCYLDNAKRAFMESGNAPASKGDNQFVSKVAGMAAVAGPVTFYAAGMSGSGAACTSSSFWAMVAGAAALVVGDNLANFQHKKRLQKIKEEWGKIVNPEEANGDKDKERETSIESQSEAFEMLAKSEDSLASAAKMKKNFFMIATIAYGVSAAIAGYELYTEHTLRTTALSLGASAAAQIAAVPAAAAEVTTSVNQVQKEIAEVQAADVQATVAPTPDVIAKAKARAITIKAAAVKLSSDVAVASAAAAAQSTSTMGTDSAATAKAVEAVGEAAAATNKWMVHKQTVDCVPLGLSAVEVKQEKDSLYANYSSGTTTNIKEELQALYNLSNSTDLVSFIMNKKQIDGEEVSIEEFEKFKLTFRDLSIDKDVFETFKSLSLMVMSNINPLSSAVAQDATTAQTANTPVNTNAAASYREVKSQSLDIVSPLIGGVGGYFLAQTTVGKWMITSMGRLTFSGIMGLLTLQMANHAGSQAEASTKRAQLLRQMKDEFKTASGAIYACKSEDRNDPGKPNCYCYTPENGRNPNRTGSDICNKLWTGVNTKATTYNSTVASSKICVANNGAADTSCKCKTTNTCMKVGVSGLKGISTGTMSMLSNPLQTLNGVTSGNVDAASIDSASLANMASKVNELNKKIEGLPGVSQSKKTREKAKLNLQKEMAKNGASINPNNSLGSSSSMGMPSNPGEAARMLEKEIENSKLATPIGGGNDFIATPASDPTPQLEFGMTQDELANQEGQIAEVMNQDLDYGKNDMNPDSKANIFEVLSHRYQRSGMKRLFDDTPAPAQTATAPTKQ